MKVIKHIRRDFHSLSWDMPQGLGLGGAGGQKFNFLNMVMWHIKLKGMSSRPGYTENIWVGLGGTLGGWGGSKKKSEIQPDLVCELHT